MIEIVKENGNVASKRENPVNVRPIGDPKGNEKVYVEDYIETFIRQVANKDDYPKVLILYGETKTEDEYTRHYVCGAVLADELFGDEKTVFGDSIWKEVNKKAGRFFQHLQVMGWAYIRNDIADLPKGKIQYTHNCCFRKDQKVFLEYSPMEKKEQVFLVKDGRLERQSGHFIYYERNEPMQNYMITMKQEEAEELRPEVDQAAKKCRGIVREKKEEIKHKQTLGMLYGTSMAMLLVVTIVGVTLLNNYNKMQDMEVLLHDISNQMAQDAQDEEDALMELYGVASKIPSAETDLTKKELQEIENGISDKSAESITIDENESETKELDSEKKEEETERTDETKETGEERETEITETPENPTKAEETGKELAAESSNSDDNEDVPELVDNTELVIDEGIELADISQSLDSQNSYLIEKGDTLSKISIRFYGDESRVEQICRLNEIADKNAIQYGVNILLP